MENNKYYTPDISDLFVGYECETHDTWEWRKITITEEDFKSGFIRGCGSGNDRYCILHKIRTPYLTKEQIEAEGWVYKGIGLAESRPLLFGKDNLFEIVFYSPDHLVINQFGGTLQYQHRYIGCCPSINEFRKLCKWIGI